MADQLRRLYTVEQAAQLLSISRQALAGRADRARAATRSFEPVPAFWEHVPVAGKSVRYLFDADSVDDIAGVARDPNRGFWIAVPEEPEAGAYTPTDTPASRPAAFARTPSRSDAVTEELERTRMSEAVWRAEATAAERDRLTDQIAALRAELERVRAENALLREVAATNLNTANRVLGVLL